MFSGGSSSGVAVACQSLGQELGIVYMCGLTHSNDTTGKDKRRYGFRHFFNAYMSGRALGPVLAQEMGKDRRAYHLTADYTWGWTQEERSEEHTSELQSLMRISYAVFCLKKKIQRYHTHTALQ